VSGQRHDEISALFLEACKLPAEERATFLDEACAGDRELREEVESLLPHDENCAEILEPGAIPLALSPDTELAPQQIGPFTVEEQIGEGGMGVVYRARQEQPIQREVAIKLIRLGIESSAVMARFETERQALALMNHPNIACVLDAGTTEQGRPYFAMEYVDGERITLYCDKQRLDIDERLQLFMEVCDGVGHAHQKAIIHRDIKPSNVLVTSEGGRALPKIIDFGVAKATDKKLAERAVMTELGQLIGTPEYMSPEQAELGGQAIDTRTDVYSLGALLYEIVVGVPTFDPQELRELGIEEILRRVREDDPLQPSQRLATLSDAASVAARRRTDPTALARRLRGDLDVIAMKALHKDPALRYASPAELAADLQRHMNDEPVLASPPSTWYRTGKLIRKHKVGFVFSVSLVVLLLGFAISMTVQASRIARERDRAGEAARTAERTLDFTMGLLDIYDPHDTTGNASAAREMLDLSLAKIEKELGDQPLAQAQLLVNAGKVYRRMGLNDQARAVVERGWAGLKTLLPEDHPDTLQAEAELAYLYFYERRFDEAEPLFLHAIEGLESSLGPDDDVTLHTKKNLANLYTYRGDYTEAEQLHLHCLEKLRETLGDDDPTTLRSMNELGILYRVSGHLDKAEPLLAEALASQRRVMGAAHPFTLSSMNSLAVLYLMQSRYDEAEPLLRESLDGKRLSLGESHPSTLKTTYNLACLAALDSRNREALDLLTRAADHGYINERIGGDPDLTSLHGDPEFEAIVARVGGTVVD